ncbi:MAG: 23S rRNA (pseudouridine(1915)-N(3))-methyltransferase RlmH [Planctomycetota bacterium]|nr:23S rRNA (pseudouridine(1915)-N(3))-methyltransferase RlmH [Planctomycetota bacterium]MEC8251767.1 23S rRNA (pseudouridine(1915)-N(3))-methyltransferase RlmH [Planctomycetota bacterium]MEC9049044.1 23S rRNA (pseudouridine(1915)-N(3))-methyltransferase RlmH [Planctomycetota bacterium]
MKVRLVTVSQRQPRWVLEGCAEYEKRLPRAWQFELVEVKPESRTTGADPRKVRAGEAARVRSALPKNAILVALDERGAAWSTLQFAERIEQWQHAARDLAFVIGGADGLDPELRSEAAHCLSLSPMVMPHGLARVMFVEQLYRAATIIAGHPYHK